VFLRITVTPKEMSCNLIREKYPLEEGYIFKSCCRNWIVVLKKLEDTKSNESRCDITNPLYVKYRANKLLVVDIIHKITGQTVDKITNSVYIKNTIKYEKGLIVQVSNFDENLNNICTSGIHYFKTPEMAYYYEFSKITNGVFKTWYDNGQLETEYMYKNGKLHGTCKTWHKNGQLAAEYNCIEDNLIGLYRQFDENGKLYIECVVSMNSAHLSGFQCGIRNHLNNEAKIKNRLKCVIGAYKEFHPITGNLMIECYITDGLLNGSFKVLTPCKGEVKIEYTYENGNKV
jgi:antitoxin component YwqK of YwqJK toxin-antitoxin module